MAEERANGSMDRFGFYADPSRDSAALRLDAAQRKREAKELARAMKWSKMLARWPNFEKQHPAKLRARIRKGIPNAHRSTVWAHLGRTAQLKEEHGAGRWASLCQEAAGVSTRANTHTTAVAVAESSAAVEGLADPKVNGQAEAMARSRQDIETQVMIEKDLPRTFPHHSVYRRVRVLSAESDDEALVSLEPRGVGRLRSVLRAYACYDREAGYCQGMSFVAAMMLMYYPPSQGPEAERAAARARDLAVEAAALSKVAEASKAAKREQVCIPTRSPRTKPPSSPRVSAWPSDDRTKPLQQRDKDEVRAEVATVAAATAAAELASQDEGAETVFWLLVSVLWRPGRGNGGGGSGPLARREFGNNSRLSLSSSSKGSASSDGWRLRECYLPSMGACHASLHVFNRLLAKHVPDVSRHVSAEGLEPSMFATPWYEKSAKKTCGAAVSLSSYLVGLEYLNECRGNSYSRIQ